MLKFLLIISVIILVVLFFEMLFRKVITLGDVKDSLLLIFKGIVERVDKLLTGNDGLYSHIKFINILWGVGCLSLIWICVLREIKIQGEILFLMGAAIGISGIQAVANKAQEVKTLIGEKNDQQN